MLKSKEKVIGIVGLGYVGLPLAVEFGKKRSVIGFDININRINELHKSIDRTLEVSTKELKESKNLTFSNNTDDLKKCEIYIVTVPTPIDSGCKPDLDPLIKASEMLGSLLKQGDVIIYESTVFPGATEEICVKYLEKKSNLKFNVDFFVGYSPERINPGDKTHRLPLIKKITSGSTPAIAAEVDALYGDIIQAGTYMAESIKVAEAAKVIENTQRDLNIALINELAFIFDKMEIDTQQVLNAAGTKWNFLNFQPGLVGGHCIGVDPYYLTFKAESLGYTPEIILAGRRINNSVGEFVIQKLLKEMIAKKISISKARVLILGLTFKENCPDLRNTKVIDLINELKNVHISPEVYDPWVEKEVAMNELNIDVKDSLNDSKYDAVIFAVGHDQFKSMTKDDIFTLVHSNHVIFDIKSIFPRSFGALRL
ncbi:nucleotide sugar dehydrogenase [Pseudomonadota bacterium]|nr:Vi polysaccharide biosynthesis protein VipA/TviB [Euryarchaeota archaeon]MDC0181049.1 nucleotide sugar dehydrogenase [Pseudomonadota bacterium]|tara:strand:+ start:16556 stop:17833 length:1278 start_codon:yes stop_codon:yes gene_type:complete